MNLFYTIKDNCKIDEISEKIIELLVKEKITYAGFMSSFRTQFFTHFLISYLNLFQFPFDNQKYFFDI